MAVAFEHIVQQMLHLSAREREEAIDAFFAGKSDEREYLARLVCNQFRRECFATIQALTDNRTAEACCNWFATRTPHAGAFNNDPRDQDRV